MAIDLYLVDDHSVVRFGLKMLLDSEDEIRIVGEAESAEQALEDLKDLKPDIVLMDISLPGISGIEITRKLKDLYPEMNIIALTIHEDEEYFFKMLDAGASGYVPKRAAPDELITAIRVVFHGDVYLYPSLAKLLLKEYLVEQESEESDGSIAELTPRQKEVLILLGEGASNQLIAEELSISPNTVARHRENIMEKLNLHSRTDLVKYAIKKGYIEL